MMKPRCFQRVVVGLAALFACGAADATPLVEVPIGGAYLDAQYVVGSGANLSIVIVDFENTGGNSYAFGYRWDTATDFGAVVQSIAADGPLGDSLVADLVEFPPFGFFVDNYEYRTEAGDPDDFWRIEVGTYNAGAITWESSDTGMSSLTTLHYTGTPTFDPETFLGTAGIIGFYNSFANSAIKPRVPTAIVGDFDDDDDVDADDIDILWHIVRGAGVDPNDNDSADLNGDSLVNEDDVDTMLAGLLTVGPNRAYGDANLSGGAPELADYNLWRTGTGGWAGGDFDGSSGVPELNDYNLWRIGPTQFPGTVGSHSPGAPGGAPLVPEPATIVLLGLGLPGLMLLARRRTVCK